MAKSVIPLIKDNRIGVQSTGYTQLRNLEDDTTTYFDFFDSNLNGIIFGISANGISAYRMINGHQTTLFQNH